MIPSVCSLLTESRNEPSLFGRKSKWRQLVLIGAIAPVSLAITPLASAVDRVVPPNFTINSDTGSPVYTEGLLEGFVTGSNNTATANPFNSSPELTLRMGQTRATGVDLWADQRTWIYTGQLFTGPTGVLSIAANNDDFDWFRIGGVVVLENNTWNQANSTVVNETAVPGFLPNTWVDFEYRVGNGGGGAGPSGQNNDGAANWNEQTGVVFAYKDVTVPDPMTPDVTPNPLDAAIYTLGKPTEEAGGGPTLFRYQSGLGFSDDLRVTGSGTITIDGNTPLVTEPSLRFENAAPATLTVNDGTGVHKTLAFSGGTTLATNTAPSTIAGTTDVRLGRISDGALTGVRLIAGGPGQLIIDYVDATNPSDLSGTTLEAGAGGRLMIRGNSSLSPLAGLTTPLTISGAGGVINIGSASGPQTYENAITATESGVLEHSTSAADTIGSATLPITIAAGKTLTVKNTGGLLTVASNITGGTLATDGTATVNYTGSTNLNTLSNVAGTAQFRGVNTLTNVNVSGGKLELRGDTTATNVNVTGGRAEFRGNFTLSTNPVIANGGTLALLKVGNTGTIANPLTVSSGNLEFVPGSIGSNTVALTGGMITLAPGLTGLNGNFYDIAPPNENNMFPAFRTREEYLAFFQGTPPDIAAPTPTVTGVLTSAGDTAVLSFDPTGGNTQMFSAYGFNNNDNIIARLDGKVNVPTTGTYTFSTRSDDGSVVFLDGTKIVDNNFFQGMTTRSGTVFLTAGLHDIDIGYYEGGGGNGLEVFWAGPGFGSTTLSNSVLFPDATPTTFANVVDVQQNSAINSIAPNATITTLNVQDGVALTTTGGPLTATTLTLMGSDADRNYTINTAGGSTFTANDVASGGAPVKINKTGTGVFAIDDLTSTSPQFPAGSTITVSEGALGILLGGPTNPLGLAALAFNGGGVVLSSKGGNQTYAIPAITGNGSIEARKIASGVAGTTAAPINVTLTGNLNVTPNQTITLGTADNYILNLGGAAQGSGNVVINGGTVIDTTGTGLQNLNVALNAGGATANLEIKSNSVTLGSLGSDAVSNANVTLGVGGPVNLTFTGSGSGRFVGNLTTSGATPLTIVKNGAGAQSLLSALGSTVTSTTSAVTINSGILEFTPATLGNASITLGGGTLQMINSGLTLQAFDADPGPTGAYGTTLNTLDGVLSHYAALGAPAFVTNTAANGNLTINYNPGGAIPPFQVHEYTDIDTIEALFTGKIFITTPGSYKFSPRSDDGTTVYIDGQPISLNNFPQGFDENNQATRDGTVTLAAGYHDILMTFNEGGGGQGMFVDITGPDGSRRILSNSELFTTDVTTANAVNMTASSSIDARGGRMKLGALSWAAGTTLTSVSGTAAFSSTALPSAGTYTFLGAGSVEPGAITSTGVITLNNKGTGSLILNNTATAQLQAAGSTVSANGGGRIVAVVDSTAGSFNPLGVSNIVIGDATGGGELVISNKVAENFTVGGNLQIGNTAAISAENAGGGAISGTAAAPIVATLSSPITFGANALTLRSGPGYTLQVAGALNGTGLLNVTRGSVVTNAAATSGAINVSGGRLSANGSLTAPSATVGSGAVLRISGATNISGGTTVNTGGALEVNGATYTGGPINLLGGVLRAVGGNTTLTSAVVNGQAKVAAPGSLQGKLLPNFLAPSGGFGTEVGLLNTLAEPAAFTMALGARDFNFGPRFGADGPIATFFGTTTANTNAFTMAFTGTFTAAADGLHSFRKSINDDGASFWVDLNRNGFFELAGSAGTERLAHQDGCCGNGDDPLNSDGGDATLVAGQSYKVAIVLLDTGGGSSLAARFSAPGIPETFVNPGSPAQAGLWSSETGGGVVQIDAEAQLTLGVANNLTNASFTGANGVLRLNNAAARATGLEIVRSDTAAGINTIDLGANDTLNVGAIVVNDGSTIRKTGAGTLQVVGAALAANSVLEVNAGQAIFSGAGAGTGNILSKTAGQVIVNGSITGSVTVDSGGSLAGTGRIGGFELRAGGTLAPGNGAGTLTMGDATINGGTLALELLGAGQADRIVANAFTLTSDLALTLNLGTFDPRVSGATSFLVVDNLSANPIGGIGDGTEVGNFLFSFNGNRLAQNESFQANGIDFLINYAGGSGNDVVLTAVPEPTTAGALLCGLGSLLGMRRLRRRQA